MCAFRGGTFAATASIVRPRRVRCPASNTVRPVKVFSVVGNRPQFVKSAPLSLALRAAGIEEVVLHTGQHWDREMSQVFLAGFAFADPPSGPNLHPPTVAAW